MQTDWIRRWIYTGCALFWGTLLCAQQYYISDIQVYGNERTKEHIILRELDLHVGDSVKATRLQHVLKEAKQNLENLALFNYVDLKYTSDADDTHNLILNIWVEERWYVFPLLSIRLEDRNTSVWLKNFDLSRVSIEFGTQIYNLFGLNHSVTTGIQIGYRQALSFAYKNITLGPKQKHFLATGLSIQRSHRMDVMTHEDAPFNAKVPNLLLEQSFNGHLNYIYRYNVRITHNASFQLGYKQIADTVLVINPNYWGNDHTKRLYFNLQYFFKTDQRDYIAYPLKGYFLKTGAHFYTSGDLLVRYLQLYANAQYHKMIGERWYASEVVTAGISTKNKKAYLLDQALGYGESALRGYEYHVVDGQHYVNLNSTLRYNILPKTVFVIDWLSFLPKFNKIHFALYANAFFDMGAAYHQYPDPTNRLSNQFLYSGGVGLDLVTYYDIAFMLYYSMNKQREQGLFFSFKLPFM